MSALIVTAQIAPADFAWLNDLRRRHFPPDRNQLDAHLTMFHALPPSSERELRSRLGALANSPPPYAAIAGLMNLGGGVAYRIISDDLERIREQLAEGLHGLLSAQDSGGWRPHVTIQNKVAPRAARELMHQLEMGFRSRPLAISGLGLHLYLGGPWKQLAIYGFRGA
ncbi:MAG: 2'-5' RNA ligase family protein [Sphingomicrobium sp.]